MHKTHSHDLSPEVSVVVPMYNEEESVADTVSALRPVLEQVAWRWEIVLVNDGSTDGTEAAARREGANDARVRVVSYHPNGGRGKALRTGLAHARGDLIISTEADLSWGTDIIPRFVDELRSQPSLDVVIATPHGKGGRLEEVPWLRGLISRLGNRILGMAMPGELTMMTGMTRAYRRPVLEALDLDSDGKEIHVEIISKVLALGYKVKEIPAVLSGRRKGRSKFKFKATAATHLTLGMFEKPMLLFGAIGLVCLVLSALAGLFLLWQRLAQGYWNPDRPLVTLLVLLALAGTQILCFGFIGAQIVALRKELYKVQRGCLRMQKQLEGKAKIEVQAQAENEVDTWGR